MSEAACKELGETEENSNAQYSKGACKQAGLVGSCIYPSYQQHFYSGNFAALEISCGFMDGKWVAG